MTVDYSRARELKGSAPLLASFDPALPLLQSCLLTSYLSSKYRRKSSPPPSPPDAFSNCTYLTLLSHKRHLHPRSRLIAMILSLSSHLAIFAHPLWHLRVQKMPMPILYPLRFKRPSSTLPHYVGPLFQDRTSHTHQTQCPLQRTKTLLHLVQLSLQTDNVNPPPARRSRVVSPSIRNLVLPCTPSPPPRPRLEMTPPVIDSEIVHGTTLPAQSTPPQRGTSASSSVPLSSPFAVEDEYESPEISRFHSMPCPKPKRALQVRTQIFFYFLQ